MTERCFVTILGFIERVKMFSRHDQDVVRRLRIEIVECDTHVVLKQARRGNLIRDDLAKDTIALTHNLTYAAVSSAVSAMPVFIRSMSAPRLRSLRTIVS